MSPRSQSVDNLVKSAVELSEGSKMLRRLTFYIRLPLVAPVLNTQSAKIFQVESLFCLCTVLTAHYVPSAF